MFNDGPEALTLTAELSDTTAARDVVTLARAGVSLGLSIEAEVIKQNRSSADVISVTAARLTADSHRELNQPGVRPRCKRSASCGATGPGDALLALVDSL